MIDAERKQALEDAMKRRQESFSLLLFQDFLPLIVIFLSAMEQRLRSNDDCEDSYPRTWKITT